MGLGEARNEKRIKVDAESSVSVHKRGKEMLLRDEAAHRIRWMEADRERAVHRRIDGGKDVQKCRDKQAQS